MIEGMCLESMLSGEGEWGSQMEQRTEQGGRGLSWRLLWSDPEGALEHELHHRLVSPGGKGPAFCTPMPVGHGLPTAP